MSTGAHPRFVDTHAHLTTDDLYGQLDDVMGRAKSAGVARIVCVGTDLASSATSISISEKYPNVFAAVGVHPHDSKDAPPEYIERLRDLASHEKVVALGEMGLDFYRNLSPPEIQLEVFRRQLELAGELELPVVVHNRQADGSVLSIMETVGHRRGVVHCFSSGVEVARRVTEFGFHISFTGTVTFGKNETESVVQEMSLGSFMLETDCPFLAPVPVRGKPNEPANIRHIAAKIARIIGESLETVARVTTETAHTFYGFPP